MTTNQEINAGVASRGGPEEIGEEQQSIPRGCCRSKYTYNMARWST